MTVLIIIVALLLAIALVCMGVILIRTRMIGQIVGTFECWARSDTSSGWVSGMARFGSCDLQWFRLIGFYFGPQFRLPRAHMTVSAPIDRSEGIVEVMVESEGQRQYLAMRTEWYNGLLSWVDSSAPKPRDDYEL